MPVNFESGRAAVPLSMGELDVADAEAYLHAELDFDSSNHLAQYTNVTDRTTVR